LSDSAKRSNYDANGVVERSVEEELLDAFGGGAFKDRGVEDVLEKQTLAEALVKTKNAEASHSHSAGFEAWMRTRGDANRTIGVDDIVDAYGVVKGSYDEVRLPKIAAFETRRVVGEENVRPDGEGVKSNGVSLAFALSTTPIPNTLEWGQVLVHVRASPVNPADLAPGRGAEAGSNLVAETRKSEREKNKDALSFLSIDGHGPTSAMEDSVAGGDFIGEVLKVGAGVKALAEGDWVLPRHPGVGAWRSLFCAKEKALRKIPKDLMPLEHAAMLREYCVAYRLLEDAGDVLKPGDAVIVDGASGAIGGAVVRLCALLRLRAVAVVRPSETSDTNRNYDTFLASASDVRGDDRDAAPTPFSQNTSSKTTSSSCSASFLKTAARLKALGAAEVLVDEGDARAALERRRFFARPKLALDCVGGASAARLAHCLQDSGVLVVFGCMSGYAVTLPWTTLVARGLSCRGFSLRKWMDKAGEAKIAKMFETVAKLVVAGELSIDHCEYELSTELHEAVEHAAERRKEVKVVLRVEEVGDTYE
jgi:trans-2-enoyl-CoA reductase